MEKKLRPTYNLLRVLQAMYAELDSEHYAFALAKACGIGTSSLYLTLDRMEDAGLVTGGWEQLDPKAAGRPPRYYYRLSSKGIAFAQHELNKFVPSGGTYA